MSKVIDRTYSRFKWLATGYAVSILLSALVIIFLARMMGPENYGIYAIALLIPYSLGSIADVGTTSAVIYYISRHKKNGGFISDCYKTGLIIAFIWSISLSTVLMLASRIIAIGLFHRPNISSLLRISVFIVVASACSNVSVGALISIGKQKIVGLYYIFASILRNGLVLITFVVSRDIFLVVLAQTVGYLMAGALLSKYTINSLPNGHFDKKMIKIILSYGAPYALGVFVLSLCIQFYNFLAAILMDDFSYGNFSVAWLIFTSIMAIPSSLSTSLFPSISEANYDSKYGLASIFGSSVKFASSLLLYTWVTLGGASSIIINLIYGSKYSLAADIFFILSIVFVLGIVGWGVINPFLLSLKKTKILAIINVGSVVISFALLNIILLPYFSNSIWAIPLAFVLLHGLATMMGLCYLRLKYEVRIAKWPAFKLFLIVVILFIFVRKISLIDINIYIEIGGYLLDLMVFFKVLLIFLGIGMAYIAMLITFRVLTREDYELLKQTFFSSLKINWLIGKIADKAFLMGEKLGEFSKKLSPRNKQRYTQKTVKNLA